LAFGFLFNPVVLLEGAGVVAADELPLPPTALPLAAEPVVIVVSFVLSFLGVEDGVSPVSGFKLLASFLVSDVSSLWHAAAGAVTAFADTSSVVIIPSSSSFTASLLPLSSIVELAAAPDDVVVAPSPALDVVASSFAVVSSCALLSFCAAVPLLSLDAAVVVAVAADLSSTFSLVAEDSCVAAPFSAALPLFSLGSSPVFVAGVGTFHALPVFSFRSFAERVAPWTVPSQQP